MSDPKWVGPGDRYELHPGLCEYKGTAIPPVCDPVRVTPRIREIAEWVFWRGPYWAILRNGVRFLFQVMDYGRLNHVRDAYQLLPAALWRKALDEACPKTLSRGSFFLWSRVFGRDPHASGHNWASGRHVQDARSGRWALPAEEQYRLAERAHHAAAAERRTGQA